MGSLVLLVLLAGGGLSPAVADTLAAIQASGTFNICANPEALPYTSNVADLRGFQLELHAAIARSLGWRDTVTWVYNRDAVDRTNCGGYMGRIIAADVPPLENSLNTEPYMGSGFVVIVPPGRPSEFDSLSALLLEPAFRNGGTVGISLGAWVGREFEKYGVQTTPFLYQKQIIEGVLTGVVAAGVVTREDASWYLRHHPGAFSVFQVYKVDPAFRWNVGMGIRNADDALIRVINRTLARIRDDRMLERILEHYGIEYQPPFPPIASPN